MLTNTEVVIVGGGPTGATIANLLGQLDINCVILEREAATYHLPRAVQFDDEVMRTFQNIGLAETIAKTTRFNPGMRFFDDDGNMLLDWPRPTEVSRQQWHTSYRFHQPTLEGILRTALNRYNHVRLKTRCRVDNISEESDHALVTYTDLENDSVETLSARYVIGCDGANSTIRSLMQADMTNYGFEERWLVVDVLLKTEKAELGDFTIQYCRPERPATYVRGPENRRRWEITLHDNETTEDTLKPERVWDLLSQWLKPIEAEIERAAVYKFASQTANPWRKGRIMVAGDAAHLTPPFMGQGMCAGIRDAANLAWKVASVCKDGDHDDVLDSYFIERLPHVQEYIETAIRLGKIINASGTAEELHSALRQPDGSTKMKMIAPRLGGVVHSNEERDANGSNDYRGTLSSQPLLSDGTKLDDRFPYQGIVICNNQLLVETGLSCGAKIGLSIIINSIDHPDLQRYLEELSVQAVHIRPDRYIASTADSVKDFRRMIAKHN